MVSVLLKYRQFLKFTADVLLWSVMPFLAYWLRIENNVFDYQSDIVLIVFFTIPVKILFVYFLNQTKRSWQFSSTKEIFILSSSITLYSTIYLIVAMIGIEGLFIPLSVPLIEGLLSVLVLGALRITVRVISNEDFFKKKGEVKQKRILIAGAGNAGAMIAREMIRNPRSGYLPVAFLDDAIINWGQNIMGIPVVGRTSQMSEIARKYSVDELIIAIPSVAGDVIKRLVELARSSNLQYRIIPGLYDLIKGKVEIDQIRKVDVEDLLRRAPVSLNTNKIKIYLKDRVVMVTGAGGSIGSEIVRQVAKFSPKLIILLGRGENSVYNIQRNMRKDFPEIEVKVKICDVRDYNTLAQIFETTQPDVIFHAAAHKHVPLMEENPSQAIFNNVGGTRNLVNLSLDFKVKHFVNISTDKAVNPTSVMGASKRISEYVVQQGAKLSKEGQKFVSVRFGNVLGSRGSVIPIFKEQIRMGGPVTVTHPEMVRYFMTIPEASQLVLQAGALDRNGAVFVLDMGEPMKIVDMARELIKLSGLEPDKDIKIQFSGIRDGEKLFEELLTAEEGTSMTQFEKIMVANNSGLPENLHEKLDNLFIVAKSGNGRMIREKIKELVPSYHKNDEEINITNKKFKETIL